MLPYCKKLLTDALLGDNQKYLEFKYYLALFEAHVPSPQQIADFLFQEPTFTEFVEGSLNNELYKDVIAGYQNNDFVVESAIAVQLRFFCEIKATYLIRNLHQQKACLSKIIDADNATTIIKALATYTLGTFLQDAGQFDLAIALFSQAIQLNLRSPYPFFGRGFCNLKQAPHLAIVDLEKAHHLSPSNIPFLLTLAEAYTEIGENQRAMDAYFKVHKLVPSESPLEQEIRNKIIVFADVLRNTTTLPIPGSFVFTPANLFDPTPIRSVTFLRPLTVTEVQPVTQEKTDSIIPQFNELYNVPRSAVALNSLRPPLYKALLTQALQGDRGYLQFKESLYSLDAPSPQEVADFLFKEHTFAEFMAVLFKYDDIGRDIGAWYQNKSFVLEGPVYKKLKFVADLFIAISVDDLEEQTARLKKIITNKSVEGSIKALAHYYRAFVSSSKKRGSSVLEDYTKAIELNPTYAAAYRDRGHTYFDRRSYDLARDDFDMALTLDPNDSRCFFYRGQLNAKSSPANKAASHDFLEAYRLAVPGSPDQKTIRNSILNIMKFSPKPLNPYRKNLTARQSPNTTFSGIGNFHFDQGDYAVAEDAYNKAIALYINDVEVIYMRAVTRAQQGKMQEALDDFLQAYLNLPANLDMREKIIHAIVETYPCYTNHFSNTLLEIKVPSSSQSNPNVPSSSSTSTSSRYTLFPNAAAEERPGKKRKLDELVLNEKQGAAENANLLKNSNDEMNMDAVGIYPASDLNVSNAITVQQVTEYNQGNNDAMEIEVDQPRVTSSAPSFKTS